MPTTKFPVPKGGGSDTPISWRKLMALRQTGPDVFESLTPAWPPAPFKRAFGGHVYAQAVVAASRTVERGLVVHQVTGYFLLPGAIDIPYTYRVHRIRDGGMYSLRGVDVYQDSDAAAHGQTPCFTATVSFKRPETGRGKKWAEYEYQNVPKDHVGREYRDVLDGLRSEDHPLAPGADALWWEREEAEFWGRDAAAFPGVETRKVDMGRYNGHVEPGGGRDAEQTGRYRQLLFYRLIQDEESDSHDGEAKVEEEHGLNLHAAAHMYASDRNSLFLIQRALGYETVRTTMASLSHTVIFHGPADRLCMVDKEGQSKWFVQESWTSHGGDNRGCHNSSLWSVESGRVIGTTVQDGMLRFPAEVVRRLEKGEKGSGRRGDSKL